MSFSLKPIVTRPVQMAEGRTGRFRVLDFPEVTTPGTHRLRAGDRETQPFRIGDDVRERTVWKAINCFYAERRRAAIPGVHDVCHADRQGEHDGRRSAIHGDWHDTDGLSRGLVHTAEAVYAMFDLAGRLERSYRSTMS